MGGCEQILEGGVETERCEAGAAVALLCCSAAKEKGAGREPAPLTQSVRARGGGIHIGDACAMEDPTWRVWRVRQVCVLGDAEWMRSVCGERFMKKE